MKKYTLFPLVVIALMLGVAACGELSNTGSIQSEPALAQSDPAPAAAQFAEMNWPDEAQALIEKAVKDITQRTGLAASAVQVVEVEAVDWPNSCLGCAKDGEMCLEVITPGYRLVLQTDGHTFEYHTNAERVVLCLEEAKASMSVQDPSPQVVPLVVSDLADRLEIAAEAVSVVEVEEVTWPDSSMGCPQPGYMYLQVITPGYRIVLEAQGQTYNYHTDSAGHFVLCP